MIGFLSDAAAWVIPVLLAVTLHEAAHGFVAERFGDSTARRAGRVTLNPLKHVDTIGTVILPALLLMARSPFLFGYAKPVPVDFRHVRPLRIGMIAVALAGPLMNILLALISGWLLRMENWVTPEQAPWLYLNLYRSLIINTMLATFNMLPLLPLDGGRVLRALLPGRLGHAYGRTERFGFLALIAIIIVIPWLTGVNILERLVADPAFALLKAILYVTGNAQAVSL